MNIAVLTITDEWGGAERATVGLVRTLCERGHTAKVVCLTERTHRLYGERGGCPVDLTTLFIPTDWWKIGLWDSLQLFAGKTWDLCILVKGSFLVGRWTIDVAARWRFGNYITVEQLQPPAAPPKSARCYFGFFRRPNFWWFRQRVKGFVRSLGPKKVICVSDTGRTQLLKEFLFPEGKVVTVHNGIDPERFQRDEVQRNCWRQQWNIPAAAVVIGLVGRLSQRKGYESALIGFQALVRQFPEKDFRFVFVGEGPHEQALRKLAGQIAPSDRVIFSPFCDRPWEPLSALDVFVMPSLTEGLPLALLEAMACGCCVVASAVGGIPEVITTPELGWLVPAGDTEAFTVAMTEAASRSPEERAGMGARAREHVSQNFNASVQFSILADTIESVAARSYRRPACDSIPSSRVN